MVLGSWSFVLGHRSLVLGPWDPRGRAVKPSVWSVHILGFLYQGFTNQLICRGSGKASGGFRFSSFSSSFFHRGALVGGTIHFLFCRQRPNRTEICPNRPKPKRTVVILQLTHFCLERSLLIPFGQTHVRVRSLVALMRQCQDGIGNIIAASAYFGGSTVSI